MKIIKNLDNLDEEVMHLGNKVISTYNVLIKLLTDFDKEVAIDIIKKDDYINKMDEEINDEAITSLALLSPVATDLRRVITCIKMSAELERIADYAKKVSTILLKCDVDDETKVYIESMCKLIIKMLEDSLVAYKERDVDAAFNISEVDHELDKLYKEALKVLIDKHDDENSKVILLLSDIFRAIERAGDHIVNICELVIFLVKNKKYDLQ